MSGSPVPGKQMWENKNGFFRDGYCRTGNGDYGNHTVAATVTQEFLDFTSSRGNNLTQKGVQPGTKWCLCASRWKEAMEAAKSADDPVVPKVFLHATANAALKDVQLADLKKFAAEGETGGSQSGRAPRGMAGVPNRHTVHTANTTGGIARDEHPDVEDHPEQSKYSKEYKGA